MRKVRVIVRAVSMVAVLLLLLAFPLPALAWSPPTPPPPPPPAGAGGGAPYLGPPGGRWGERVQSEPEGGFGNWGMPATVGPVGTVQGYIVDLTTGKRMEQVKIKINDVVVTSDWDGFYSLTGAPEGDYRVELLLEPGQGTSAQGPVMVHVGRNGAALSLGVYSGGAPTYAPPARLIPPPLPPALVMPAVPHAVPSSPQDQIPPYPPGLYDPPLFNFGAPPGGPQWGQSPYFYAPLGLSANSDDSGKPGNPGDSGGSDNSGDSGTPGNPTGALASTPARLPVTVLSDAIALILMAATLLAAFGSTRRLLLSQS
jgi:hypothetical protein